MTIDESKTTLSRHPDRSIDDKFERVVMERDDLAGALVETERENDRLRAKVAELADQLANVTADRDGWRNAANNCTDLFAGGAR